MEQTPSKIVQIQCGCSVFSAWGGGGGGGDIAGGARPFINIPNATTALAMALKYGLQILDTIGCTPVIVESDSLELIKVCNREIDL
jgi:hypothetical protein